MLTEKPVASYDCGDSKTSWLLNAQWAKIRKVQFREATLFAPVFLGRSVWTKFKKKHVMFIPWCNRAIITLANTFHCCSCTIFPIFSSLWSCVISQLLHSTFFNQKVKDYTRQRRLSSLSTSGNSWLVVAFIGRKGWPWDFYSEKMSDYQTITLTSSYMYKVRTQRRPSITANTYVKNLKIK